MFSNFSYFRFQIDWLIGHKAYKKAQLTQGLRATAVRVWRPYGRNISSAGNPTLEPNMKWIGCTICEIFAFKLYCDLETGVRGHSRSSKVALGLFDRANTTLYSSSVVNMPLSNVPQTTKIMRRTRDCVRVIEVQHIDCIRLYGWCRRRTSL